MLIDDGKKKLEVQQGNPEPKADVTNTEALMALVSQLAEVSKIQMAREQRLAKSEEEEAARKAAKSAQYDRNRADDDKNVKEQQARCQHLKGGRHRKRGSEKDYAVYLHRFIDNSQYVKCMLCKMKWYPTDTVERLVRGGRVFVNHTGKGWREALLMMEDSTNTPSMSEIPQATWARVQAAEEIPDSIPTLIK